MGFFILILSVRKCIQFSRRLLSNLCALAQGEDGDYYYILDSGHTDVFIKKGGKPQLPDPQNHLFPCMPRLP
jgi:hypothetical protein